MGCSSSQPLPVRVVIVGGGFAGVTLGKLLDPQVDVVIVERKDRLYINIGAPRALVQDGFEDRLFVPYDRLLKRGRILHGIARSIDAASNTLRVLTESGTEEDVPYDYLVMATGATYASPFKAGSDDSTVAKGYLAATRAAIRAARDIVILGGGPAGVEVAGEISTEYPEKSVTIVHSGPAILSNTVTSGTLTPVLAQRVSALLANQRVNLVLNQRATVPAEPPAGVSAIVPGVWSGRHTTVGPGGFSIAGDVTILATGGTPNSQLARSSLSPDVLDATGRIKVTPTFQVVGYPNILALGDVAGYADNKTAAALGGIAPEVAKNIVALARAKLSGDGVAPTLIQHKTPALGAMFVTTGRKTGAGAVGGMVLGSFIVSMAKGSDMFSGKFNGDMGYKAGMYEGAPIVKPIPEAAAATAAAPAQSEPEPVAEKVA